MPHQEMPLESLLCKEKAIHLFYAEMPASSDGLEDSGKVCCGQMSPCLSLFLEKKMDIEFSVPKTKGTNQTFFSDRWRCISANGMGDLHLCEGTIDVEAYIWIIQRHKLLSR